MNSEKITSCMVVEVFGVGGSNISDQNTHLLHLHVRRPMLDNLESIIHPMNYDKIIAVRHS